MKKFTDKYGKTWFYNLSEAEATIMSLLNGDRFVSKTKGEMFGFRKMERVQKALDLLNSGTISPKAIAHKIISREI